MTKAIVIRAGDPALSAAIARGLESPELRRLRAELGVRQQRDSLYWQDKCAAARRKYRRAAKPLPKVWGWIGLVALLMFGAPETAVEAEA